MGAQKRGNLPKNGENLSFTSINDTSIKLLLVTSHLCRVIYIAKLNVQFRLGVKLQKSF